MITQLYPIQVQLMENIRATIRSGVKRLVVQASTGFGKTKCAAAILEGALEKGNKVSFVVPAIALVDQCVESFWKEGIREVGVLQGDHAMQDMSKPIQVCSIQTITSRKVFPQSRIVIFDEVHRMFDAHRDWLADPAFADAIFIGMSATPWTRGLGVLFQSLLVAATTQELIDSGHLSKFKVYACPKADVSRVKIVAGDYQKTELSGAMRGGTLTADVVATWKEKWGKDKTLVFGVDRAHAETLHMRFLDQGIRSAYQDAQTSDGDRKAIERGFHNGQLQVVCNIGTLTTGVDWDVRCLVLARPTKSEILYTQIIGRALRTAPGKDYALILDHSDTTQELGFVTDIHHDHLHDGKKREAREAENKSKSLPRPCPQCASLTPRLARVCQDCGFKLPLASGVTEKDGVLVELVPGQMHAQKKGAARTYTVEEKRRFHAELLWWARDRDKSPGWVLANYRQKHNEWPPRGWTLDEPMGTSFEVASWLRSRQIAWAKGRAKAQRMGEAAE